jgi:glucosamine--fructose-6-phosphate aminotransferase (isomerizing)
VRLPFEAPFDWKALDRVVISACGTAYYAGLVGKYWMERFARLPVEIDVASEFRYREAPLPENGLALFVSQSGETADTLAALRYAKDNGQNILSVVNVPTSSIARAARRRPILAGPEIGVASTKAFTCQLAAMACLAIAAGKARGTLSPDEASTLTRELMAVPGLMAQAMTCESAIKRVARDIAKMKNALYLGRGTNYPLALEGSLKLKEISYIHAEAYAAGELKHGPIALIDEAMPVIIIAPSDGITKRRSPTCKRLRRGAAASSSCPTRRAWMRRASRTSGASSCRRWARPSRRSSTPSPCSSSPITRRSR